jgi:Na+/H+ antiporter NhaC
MTSPLLKTLALVIFLGGLLGGLAIGLIVEPDWTVQRAALDVQQDADGLYYIQRGERSAVENAMAAGGVPTMMPEQLHGQVVVDRGGNYFRLTATRHLGVWSLLPAAVAIGLCLTLRDPIVALLIGVVCAALMLGQYDLTEEVLMPSLASTSAAGVMLLYLWLLGGLMGIWSRTGAAQAFADWATRHLVRGPRTAKLVAWGLGVLFFQGGTVSTVLVGTSVKPIADEEKVSHEELSYIVDSTASPIAILLAFNAWPLYVQTLIFVPGVAVLATEQDRLSFFFSSLPLSFYAWFAVLGTFLLSIDKAPILGKQMRAAIRRARETGQLDAPGAEPLAAPELQASHVPEGYRPSVWEFAIPLIVLTAVAIGTFVATGSPQVRWAFGLAVLTAAGLALGRGMTVHDLMIGVGTGFKGVVVASIILMLAITLGSMTKQTGGGAYLVSALGDALPHWLLPAALMLMSMVIAFATGTSWGTFAVAFPLAMPLAASIGTGQELQHPTLYLMVCFAAVLNGSVYGDQCSPISDTTILSSMTTGADLIDHVKTQLVPATAAAVLAVVGWTVIVAGFC